MSEVESGDTARIHYTGTLSDGSVFDSSQGNDPLEFVVGSGQIIPGLDVALLGMKVGDEKRVEIASEDAYGPHHAEARQAVPRTEIPADIPLEVGLQLQAKNERGEIMPLTVAEITDETVVLDANHPLAGKDLTFEIELVSVN